VYAAIAAACDSSPVEVESFHEAAAKPSRFDASPNVVDLGSTATSTTVTLQTGFNRAVSWQATESAGWLSLATTSGTVTDGSPKKLSLTVQRAGLAAGDYVTDVTINSNHGGGTETIRVKMRVSSSTTFTVTPLLIDFGTTTTGLSVVLKNSGANSVSWTATESAAWLALSATSGTIAAKSQKTVAINVSRAGRTPGTYSTSVKFAAGTAGSATVVANMTVPSTSSGSVLLSGQLVHQFNGSALAGITVMYGGKTATTNTSGMFTISGSPTSTLQQLTLSGSGVYKRITFARTGDTKWRVVPSGFNMSAFNDVARQDLGTSTVRWVSRPTVYVDSRPEGFSSAEMSTWTSQVKLQAAEFVSKWSGAMIQPASVIVTSSPPADFTSGTVVIHISDNSSDYGGSSTAIGYARLSWSSTRSIRGSAVWLRYSRYPGTSGASKRRGILGHELGHAMGLGHMNGGTASFMQPSVGSNTDLNDFDRQVASLLYTRSPNNSSPDTDSSSSFLGMLVPSGAVAGREWVCDAGEEL
jgi:hypothetical protein